MDATIQQLIDEVNARSEAANKLAEIAKRFPDLVVKFGRALDGIAEVDSEIEDSALEDDYAEGSVPSDLREQLPEAEERAAILAHLAAHPDQWYQSTRLQQDVEFYLSYNLLREMRREGCFELNHAWFRHKRAESDSQHEQVNEAEHKQPCQNKEDEEEQLVSPLKGTDSTGSIRRDIIIDWMRKNPGWHRRPYICKSIGVSPGSMSYYFNHRAFELNDKGQVRLTEGYRTPRNLEWEDDEAEEDDEEPEPEFIREAMQIAGEEYATFTREQEQELFRRMRKHDCQKSRHLLIRSQIGWAKKLVAKHYLKRAGDQDADELFSIANLACIEAVDRFDPTRGNRLTTAVPFAVKSAMRMKYLPGAFHVPSSIVQDKTQHDLIPSQTALDYTHESGALTEKVGVISDPIDDVMATEISGRLRAAMNTLDERRQQIIHGRFFEGKTLEEISVVLGVSRERVRQLEAKALKELRLQYGRA